MNAFAAAVSRGFTGFIDFKGRARRKDFWFWVLFVLLASFVLRLVEVAVFGPAVPPEPAAAAPMPAAGPLSGIFSLVVLLPSLAYGVRRLRDAGLSPWFILLGLIPVIGSIALIILYVQPSREASERRLETEA